MTMILFIVIISGTYHPTEVVITRFETSLKGAEL